MENANIQGGDVDFKVRGKVNWKGVGDQALEAMSKAELLDYVQMLEAAIFSIHQHFWYYGPISCKDDGVSLSDIGFDDAWKHVGMTALSASLKMYKVHSTPFIPSQKPDNVKRNI